MSNDKGAKLKALKMTIERLDKAYGKGTVMRLGDREVVDIPVILPNKLRYLISCIFIVPDIMLV